MRIATVSLLCTIPFFTTAMAIAEELVLTPAEIANLAIRTEAPVAEHRSSTIEATATVVVPPSADIIVAAPLSGMASSLRVSAGEPVQAGQVVAEVRSAGFIELQREFLTALNNLRLAETELARDEQLFGEGIISERRVQEAGVRQRIAATGYREHRQLLAIAGLSTAEVDALEHEQQLMQHIRVRSPIDGVVIEQLITSGERLDGMSPLYRVADLTTLWLAINVRQQDLAAVRPGLRVEVVSAGASGEIFAVGRSVDPVTQTSVVRAVLDRGDGLSPGQFVQVQIVAESAAGPDGVWSVPATALTQSGGVDLVFVESPQGFTARAVNVLGGDGGRVRIRAALEPGDRVVVSGVAILKAIYSERSEPGT